MRAGPRKVRTLSLYTGYVPPYTVRGRTIGLAPVILTAEMPSTSLTGSHRSFLMHFALFDWHRHREITPQLLANGADGKQ